MNLKNINKIFKLSLFGIFFILFFVEGQNAWGFVLAKNHATDFIITIPKEARAVEKTAALELKKYLERVTGATFLIRRDNRVSSTKPQILVGEFGGVISLLPDIQWNTLSKDSIIIKTHDNKLILSGGYPRGVLYAVYTFLEEYVGCRWWSASESHIPRRKLLEVADLDIVYTPPFIYREAFYNHIKKNPSFAVKLKLNGHFSPIPDHYGGNYTILGFVHTFYQLLPPEKYFHKHPDWYYLSNDERFPHLWTPMCLTNEKMRKELTKQALKWIRKNPEAEIISISQNDGKRRCFCLHCTALTIKEGSPSGPLLHLVNSVAADIEKEFPDIMVETLAYAYSQEPPRFVKPRKNVIVRICANDINHFRPYNSQENNKFKKIVRKWSLLAPQLFFWDYHINFDNYIAPYPNLNTYALNLRFLLDNNVRGVFVQGDAKNPCGDFCHLRAWMLAHLMWDPSRNPAELMDVFLKGYYGSASQYIKTYLDLIHNPQKVLHLGRNMNYSFMDLELMNKATMLFDKAEQSVKDYPVLLRRVRRERLPIDHLWLMRYYSLQNEAEKTGKKFLGPQDPSEACERFIKEAKRFGTNNISESKIFSNYIPMLKSRFNLSHSAPLPVNFKSVSLEDWFDIQENLFVYAGAKKNWVETVADRKASNKKAAKMPGYHTQWAVRYFFSDRGNTGPWNLYAVIRCKGKKRLGKAFAVGLYDARRKKHLVRKSVSLQKAADNQYHTYDLGSHQIKEDLWVWVAPPGDAEAVDSIYVDRFFLVKSRKDF